MYVISQSIASQAKKKAFLKEVDFALVDDKVRNMLRGRIEAVNKTVAGASSSPLGFSIDMTFQYFWFPKRQHYVFCKEGKI